MMKKDKILYENKGFAVEKRTFDECIKDLKARICLGLIPNSGGEWLVHMDNGIVEDPHYLEYIQKAADILLDFARREKKRLT